MKPIQQSLQMSGGLDERLRVLVHTQTVDIRMGERGVSEGPLVLFDFSIPFIVMVDVVYVRYCRLRDVTPEEYRADGYPYQQTLLTDLKGYYPEVTLDSVVTVIKYANARGYWVTNYLLYPAFYKSCLN